MSDRDRSHEVKSRKYQGEKARTRKQSKCGKRSKSLDAICLLSMVYIHVQGLHIKMKQSYWNMAQMLFIQASEL